MRLWISVLPAFVPSLTSHLKQLISASLDMDAVLHEIAQAAATRTDDPSVGPPQVSFVIADEATRTLEACAFSDNTLGVGFPTKRLIFDQGGAGWVATHRQPLSVPHTFNDEHFVVRDWWRAHGFIPSPDAHDALAISAEAVFTDIPGLICTMVKENWY